MTRTRVSTTVDTSLLEHARNVRSGTTDAALIDEALSALLARYRSAEIDASYATYDEHPLDEPDEWGDLASFRRGAAVSHHLMQAREGFTRWAARRPKNMRTIPSKNCTNTYFGTKLNPTIQLTFASWSQRENGWGDPQLRSGGQRPRLSEPVSTVEQA